MPDLDFTGAFIFLAFCFVVAIAAVIAVGVSWLGYPNAALWLTGGGIVAGLGAARWLRSTC